MYSQRKQRFLVDWDSVLIFFCGHVQGGLGRKLLVFPQFHSWPRCSPLKHCWSGIPAKDHTVYSWCSALSFSEIPNSQVGSGICEMCFSAPNSVSLLEDPAGHTSPWCAQRWPFSNCTIDNGGRSVLRRALLRGLLQLVWNFEDEGYSTGGGRPVLWLSLQPPLGSASLKSSYPFELFLPLGLKPSLWEWWLHVLPCILAPVLDRLARLLCLLSLDVATGFSPPVP